MSWKQYRRTGLAEMRPVDDSELLFGLHPFVSVSAEDRLNGSPKAGDMIARNPKNHNDLWLVASKYFEENFEEVRS